MVNFSPPKKCSMCLSIFFGGLHRFRRFSCVVYSPKIIKMLYCYDEHIREVKFFPYLVAFFYYLTWFNFIITDNKKNGTILSSWSTMMITSSAEEDGSFKKWVWNKCAHLNERVVFIAEGADRMKPFSCSFLFKTLLVFKSN